jgi:hypothetical protein
MTAKPIVDWSKFQDWPRPTLTCQCGTVYQSHCKHTWHESQFVGVSQEPCPGCGAEFGHIERANHPPEKWSVRG